MEIKSEIKKIVSLILAICVILTIPGFAISVSATGRKLQYSMLNTRR